MAVTCLFLMFHRARAYEGELEYPWAMRKSNEHELFLASGMLQVISGTVVQKVKELDPWKRNIPEKRKLYNEAGRALRLCDAVQECVLEANRSKTRCTRCSAGRSA